MVFVRFSIKAFYVVVIALFLSLIYGMVGFGIFESSIGEEKLDEVFMPSFVFGLGTLLVLTEKWWRLSDPMATIVLWGLSIRFYGYGLTLLGLYLFGDYIVQQGWNNDLQSIIIFTVIANAVLLALYFVKRWRHHKQS